MPTLLQSIKRIREPLAFGLLAVATLYVISGISLLFKSRDDIFLDFAGRSALVGHVFADPIVLVSIVAAATLVAAFGEASRSARIVVVAALVIGAVAFVFAVVSWLAGLSADRISAFGGVDGAGKVVGIFLGLAQVGLLALVLLYLVTVWQSVPKPVRAPAWGQQGAYGWAPPGSPQGWGQQQWPDPYQQPPAGWGQPTQQPQPPQPTQPAPYPYGYATDPSTGQPTGWGQPTAPTWPQQPPPGWPQGQPEQAAPAPAGWHPPSTEVPAPEVPTTPAHRDDSVDEPETSSVDDTATIASDAGQPASDGADGASDVASEPVAPEPSSAEADSRDEEDSSGWWRPSSS